MAPNEFPLPTLDRDSSCDDYIFSRDSGHDCGKWKLLAGCAGAWGTYDLECGRGSSFNALADDGNFVFELYSDRNFGFGQWFSFDIFKETCCYDSHILQWILLPDPVVPLAISLSPSWPSDPALQQLHLASL